MSEIKVTVVDVDGSLTDGGVYYFNKTYLRARKFSTMDGEGFNLLKQRGIDSYIVSKSKDYEIQLRANWLGVRCFLGVANKAVLLNDISGTRLIDDFESVAYFGNDINDLEAMRLCGFSGCPSDAHQEIIEYCKPHEPISLRKNGISVGKTPSGYVCKRRGGDGAFREFADIILSMQNNADNEIGLRRSTT